MLFTDDGWIAGRGKDKTDVYLFAYGLDYREALKTFYTVSGRPPLVPRWSLGNWWSRYCESRSQPCDLARAEIDLPDPYSGKEYLGLMDRFRDEGMPLSVAVIDIDWHLMDVPEEFGTAWTGYTLVLPSSSLAHCLTVLERAADNGVDGMTSFFLIMSNSSKSSTTVNSSRH